MFESIIGHDKQKNIIKNQLKRDQMAHAYLFTGPKGIGKRTFAEAIAKQIILLGLEDKDRKILEEHADIYHIGQSDSQITINEIRELISQMDAKPLEGNNRVFIIDHADQMNPIAQNALLKTIEEPVEGNFFFLITDNPTKLLQTIRSRCQELPFHDLTTEQKLEFLKLKEVQNYPEDLTLTPGFLLKESEDPEHYQKLNHYYNRLIQIMNGNTMDLFNLAQDLSEDKNESIESLEYFIRRLNNQILDNGKTNLFILQTIDILFELLEKLSYNVNLRLQWESSLIQIISN